MRLERELTVDHLESLRAYLANRPQGQRARIGEYLGFSMVAAVVAFGGFAVVFAKVSTMSPWWFALTPVVGLAAMYPIYRALDRQAVIRFVEGNRAELGHQEFWLDEMGFGNRNAAGSTYHAWATVLTVEDAPQLVFVNARGRLYTLPKEGDDTEVEAFGEELRKRWKSGAVEQGDEADER